MILLATATSARVAECFAENALALAESVHLGCIEQRDAQGERALHDVAGRARGVAVSVAPLARAVPRIQTDATDPSDPVNVEVFHVSDRTDITDSLADGALCTRVPSSVIPPTPRD
jgi:hypothetical protein